MIIALQKKRENIIEYLLYMFNIENTLRTLNFELEAIDQQIIVHYDVDAAKKQEIRDWYTALIKEMKISDLMESGHLNEIHELITELNFLHTSLLNVYQDKQYQELNKKAEESLQELMQKSGTTQISVIEAGLNGLYGLLMLRLKNKAISPATEQGFTAISNLFALLAARYKEMKAGKLDLPTHLKN